MPPDGLRIVVAGMVAGVPGQGGATWAVLQWVLGLRELGHDVLLIEEVDRLSEPRCRYFSQLLQPFGLEGRAALLGPHEAVCGMTYGQAASFCRDADVVFNLAGTLRREPLLQAIPTRVYVDLDPGFTQVWHTQGIDMGLDAHTHFATVGLNVGQPDCRVPRCGVRWITTLPPVALSHWQPALRPPRDVWTTVANWRGYGSVEVDGVRWGQKAHTWRELLDLPSRTAERLLPALAIDRGDAKDSAALEEHGWRWQHPLDLAATPARYQRFVQGSRGELCIAKEGYVVSRSGWFSDRSACYLASGRPVVAQDTGLSGRLPVGDGLLTFRTAAQAALALEEAAVPQHRRSARALAEEHLDARQVLGRLVEVTA